MDLKAGDHVEITWDAWLSYAARRLPQTGRVVCLVGPMVAVEFTEEGGPLHSCNNLFDTNRGYVFSPNHLRSIHPFTKLERDIVEYCNKELGR